jgi:hypothetical protein
LELRTRIPNHNHPSAAQEAFMTITVNDVLRINLYMLQRLLDRARASAQEATAAMTRGERNLAIGSALDLEQLLPECEALYRTNMLLHRSRAGEELS